MAKSTLPHAGLGVFALRREFALAFLHPCSSTVVAFLSLERCQVVSCCSNPLPVRGQLVSNQIPVLPVTLQGSLLAGLKLLSQSGVDLLHQAYHKD